MSKLHEVLAVEPKIEKLAKAMIAETIKVFKDHQLFQGMQKSLKMINESPENESLEAAQLEIRTLETTIPRRLEYTAKAVAKWFDVVLQKEATNQLTKGQIVIDGKDIGEPLPATFLLGLETKLAHLRDVYRGTITLPPGMDWDPNPEEGADVWKLKVPEVTVKTQKNIQYKTVAEATDKHPAQVETWNEDIPVGRFTQTYTSGAITSARKHELMQRLDTLINAVTTARTQANNIDVRTNKIGDSIFEYLHGE